MARKPSRKRLSPGAQLSAIEYLLGRMNDDSVEDATRDKIAVALLPHTEGRKDLRPRLKDQRQAAAEEAAHDPRWRPSPSPRMKQ